MTESYYGNYSVFKILTDINQVNELVKDGTWVMLRPSEDLKLFIVGQIKPQAQRSAPAQSPPSKPPPRFDNLPWKTAPFSSEVESCPPDKIPQDVKAFMESQPKQKFSDSTYEYKLNKDWLNRSKVKKQ